MVVLGESEENFIVHVPDSEDLDEKLREEDRRRTGRYLAVTVILFIIALGLYHTVSRFASDASALVSAAMIMFLYLLWLWYASQRRKLQLKRNELSMENQVTTVLQALNNIKHVSLEEDVQKNCICPTRQDEVGNKFAKSDVKLNNENANVRVLKKHASVDDCGPKNWQFDESSDKDSEKFIRTYSVG
ncbi:uncharacterized protein LOC109541982 [Dendroctonus ponderosae]|uniref:Transmembrane protein n=1 Tax=Dendroctonus ponderosae TaxID=77166 RepID=A0AAR5Q0E4_DENPD|nr:uncharacterized protein LOC109541982 [Dendroctonus ponderosae]KAH1004279.1 hypothetical protein HUJ04_004058 [Dendroctonus ponderosae]KAH1010813.1 hypothetical protein HUJ05_005056 [Dendroctonus ponderosae]